MVNPSTAPIPRPARRRNEAFAQAFLERLAGSQGRALSRAPQSAKLPLLKPGVRPGFQLNPRFKARPQTRNSPARQARSWKTNPTVGFPLSYRSFNAFVRAAAVWVTLMESVPVERIPLSPSLLRTLFPVRPHSGQGTKEKTVPKDGLFMSALCARSIARPAGRASIFVLVDFRNAKIKKGISDSAESDSGLCPENPRPFEKGRRKLQFA